MLDSDDYVFTTDAGTARFDTDASGIDRDDGETTIDWDDVETVTVDNPPHANAFDTRRFHKLPATVARPIPQQYQFGEDSLTLKKPRAELQKAAWSLDNRPWTLGHPDTGMVADVGDIRGFWDDTHYVEGTDDLDSHLHVPANDGEAKEFIEDHDDVSVGFRNKIVRTDEYDGTVGGHGPDVSGNRNNGSSEVGGEDSLDEDSIDGYQTDMLFDHCASVVLGRCSSSEGCGIGGHMTATDSQMDGEHGHMVEMEDDFISGGPLTNKDEAEDSTSMQRTVDAPDGIHMADGMWFAVGPDEHPDDTTEYPDDAKFPVDSCENIEDAWNLRGTGDISIDESTLEARIKRAAEAKDCPDANRPWLSSDGVTADMAATSAKRYSVCGARKSVMSDDFDCGPCDDNSDTDENDTDTFMELNVDDLSVAAALQQVREQHDGVDERLDALEAYEDAAAEAEAAAEELDCDVSELSDAAAMLDERRAELEEQIDELQRPQMEEDAAYIAEQTDRFGEDADAVIDNLDDDPEAVADKRELVEDLASESDSEVTAAPGATTDGGEETETERTGSYAKTPW